MGQAQFAALSASPRRLSDVCRFRDYACLEVDVIEDLPHSCMEGVDAQLRDALELLMRDEALLSCADALASYFQAHGIHENLSNV